MRECPSLTSSKVSRIRHSRLRMVENSMTRVSFLGRLADRECGDHLGDEIFLTWPSLVVVALVPP